MDEFGNFLITWALLLLTLAVFVGGVVLAVLAYRWTPIAGIAYIVLVATALVAAGIESA